MYVDDSSYRNGIGVGIYLIMEMGKEVHYAIKSAFEVANNKVEYETLLTGLVVAKGLRASEVEVLTRFSTSGKSSDLRIYRKWK